MIRNYRIVLIFLIVAASGAVVFEATRPYRPENPIDGYVDVLLDRSTSETRLPDEKPLIYIELPENAELEGLVAVPEERREYEDGAMRIDVPALDLVLTVSAGTSQAALQKGPGLFETSGMPDQAGANVSIAGHRTRGMFYYLDRLGEGDRIQITYDSCVFTYVYYDRKVVMPSDWSVICEQGFDCCTLITCTPIGAANRRMAVRFMLESVLIGAGS